eukprot:COSAG01_NODE_5349_length_4316_cov_33.342898_6_plen_57_part_01
MLVIVTIAPRLYFSERILASCLFYQGSSAGLILGLFRAGCFVSGKVGWQGLPVQQLV